MTDLTETILTGVLTGLAAEALWESGKWTWKNREQIAQRLRPPRTIRVTVTDGLGLTDTTNVETLTGGGIPSLAQAGGGNLQVIRPYGGLPTGRAGTPTLSVQEAATPSLARRLEELASWYLHVS